jgi:RNA polymerase sigma-70 factor, ECF subfamily
LTPDSSGPNPPTRDVTRILAEIRVGTPGAVDRLLPLVYAELHELARLQMGSNLRGRTLQPTALVNELYLKLAANEGGYDDRQHFVAVAAIAMRQILVDHARKRSAAKRGDGGERGDRLTLSGVASDAGSEIDVLDLETALASLEAAYPRPAKVAELRFFGGLSVDEVAAALGVSARTVDYDWRFARAYLQRALRGGGDA